MRCASIPAAIVGLVLQTSLAFAHASLVSSDPADGAVLAAPLVRLSLTFNEPVSPLVMRLIDGKGNATTLAGYHLEGNAVVIDAPGEIGPGSHALSWRVISEDGHPVGGSVLFSIGAPSAEAIPGASEVIYWPLRAAIWLCRVAPYLGLFVGVGGLFFSTFFARPPRPVDRIGMACLPVGVVAVLVSVGLQGLDALDLPLSAFSRPLVWQTAMGTSYGVTAVIAILAFLLAAAAYRVQSTRSARLLSVAAFTGVGLALAASGHASAAYPQIVTRPAVFIHASAVAFWIGALAPLGFLLREGGTAGAKALARFSHVAPYALVALLVAGLLLATIQLERPEAILTTAYGRVFLVKLSLVVALFALAAFNRWRLTTAAEGGQPAAVRRLVLSIALEATLALTILGVVATWRFTPPPRAIAAAAGLPVSVHVHNAKAMAEVTFTPGHAGPTSASIVIMTDAGSLDAREVTLILSNPAAGIEPIRRPATKAGDGTWRVESLTIPAPGQWNVELAVLVSEFDLIRLKETVEIRP